MKWGFRLLLVLPLFCSAQKIVLLDRHFKEPILFTSSMTRETLNSRFPVFRADLDAVIKVTETLLASVRSGKATEPHTRFLRAGHTLFATRSRPVGIYFFHHVVVTTRICNNGATLELITEKDGHKKAAQMLLVFLDYLKNNRSILTTEGLP